MTVGFFDLGPDDVTEFVAANRAHPGLWLFHHIPKTAGSSLAGELSAHASPYHNILPDYEKLDVPFADRMNSALVTLTSRGRDATKEPLRSASGHLLPSHVSRLKAELPGTRTFTFLRHPLSRIVSEYSYNCSPNHPPYKEFQKAYPTFESFVLSPSEQNKQAFYMFETTDVSVELAVSEMARRYRMIGLQERYPASFLLLSSMIWKPSLPKMRQRVGDKSDKPVISDALRKLVLSNNWLDLELYNAVDRVFARITPAIWEHLKPERTE